MKTMSLRCDLTDDELAHRREQLLAELDAVDSLTEEKKEVAKEFADKIKSANAKAARLRTSLRQGYELREVPVTEKRDDKAKDMMIIRDDTGEVVTRRKLSAAEMQTTLVGIDGGKADKGGKGAKGKAAAEGAKPAAKGAKGGKGKASKAPAKKATRRKPRKGQAAWNAAEAAAEDAPEE